MDTLNVIVGELYVQLYTVSKEVGQLKTLLKQKDEKIALLENKLKNMEKKENEPGTARVSDK